MGQSQNPTHDVLVQVKVGWLSRCAILSEDGGSLGYLPLLCFLLGMPAPQGSFTTHSIAHPSTQSSPTHPPTHLLIHSLTPVCCSTSGLCCPRMSTVKFSPMLVCCEQCAPKVRGNKVRPYCKASLLDLIDQVYRVFEQSIFTRHKMPSRLLVRCAHAYTVVTDWWAGGRKGG